MLLQGGIIWWKQEIVKRVGLLHVPSLSTGDVLRVETNWRRLELGGGRVSADEGGWRFTLPASRRGEGYADAQIDDVTDSRRTYAWRLGTRLRLEARFSHGADRLQGTGGFGFWNAPFGDPTVPWPALPRAVWFFFASEPTDLPLPVRGPGRGWFASTIDARRWPMARLAPIALPLLVANQFTALRRRLWPALRRRLGISHAPIHIDITDWNSYEIRWEATGCRFLVNKETVHHTEHSPQGPLAFVCWLDNQYLVATPRGRFRAGTLPLAEPQWLQVRHLAVGERG
jgi:hypothetical protein